MKFSKLLIGGAATVAMVFGALSLTKDVHADGVPAITAGDSTVPRMDFVDISSWNPGLTVADFTKMKQHGVNGVIVKVTEGTYYVNPYAAAQVKNARAAGMQIGVYHYAKFNNPTTAVSEANYFANEVAALGLPKSTVLVDDLEDNATKAGNVTANAQAFKNRLNSLGYTKQMLYTYSSYATQMNVDLASFGNRNIWMAGYPYDPTKDDLWYSQYGAWQWNSNTHFSGVNGAFDVSIDYGSPLHATTPSAPAPSDIFYVGGKPASGYYDNGSGWFWFEGGKKFTGFRFYMGTYYWFENGVRQDNGWRTAWNLQYYTDNNGRAVQGDQIINGVAYNFGYDGTFYLRGRVNGYVDAGQGWKWYENGLPFTGFRFYMGAYYWFQNGVRQDSKWETAWGLKYYVGKDGRAMQGWQTIGGHRYYFGDNGTFFLR